MIPHLTVYGVDDAMMVNLRMADLSDLFGER
jgi:hypothetical protein